MTEILIAALPLILLLGSLLLGHYPSCEAIVRLSERISSQTRRRSAPRAARRPRAPASFAACGGLLIGLCLARRPPPLAA